MEDGLDRKVLAGYHRLLLGLVIVPVAVFLVGLQMAPLVGAGLAGGLSLAGLLLWLRRVPATPGQLQGQICLSGCALLVVMAAMFGLAFFAILSKDFSTPGGGSGRALSFLTARISGDSAILSYSTRPSSRASIARTLGSVPRPPGLRLLEPTESCPGCSRGERLFAPVLAVAQIESPAHPSDG